MTSAVGGFSKSISAWFIGKAPESMQSAGFSIIFPKFEYNKCHPNHFYAPTAYELKQP